jgi:TatD DNase family protein
MTTPLIDTHCHLTFPDLYGRAAEYIREAQTAGVVGMITVGTDLVDNLAAIDLAHRYPQVVYAAIGIHPHEARKAPPDFEEQLLELLADPVVVAMGEMGLDYHYNHSDPPTQRRVFENQLAAACRADHRLPIIIHCREALDDVISILQAGGADWSRVVFHCFGGTAEQAQRLIDLGAWLSFTGTVTFRKSDELRRIVQQVPGDRVMVETDAPYLSPEPLRNVRPNRPAHAVHTARCLRLPTDADDDACRARLTANAQRFFHLTPGNESRS